MIMNKVITMIIIRQTHYEKSDWSSAFKIGREHSRKIWLVESIQSIHNRMRYLQQILHLSWQVQRLPGNQAPWSVLLRNRMAECLLLPIVKKCIIKQLLNSVFAWYHELSKPRVCIICRSLRLRQTTQTSVLIIHDIMLNLIQNCLISRAWSAWASHVSEIPITENLFFILANANSWSSCHNFDSGYGYSNGVTKSKLNYQKSQFCPYDSLNLCSV